MKKLEGFLFGISSSASFGMIPLFAIPVMRNGMDFLSVLLYRFIIATIFLALILLHKKENLLIKRNEILPLSLLSVFYIISSVFLMWGYKFMSSGIATTIHFMYPVITTVVMMVFFKEKKSWPRSIAILMAIIGVYFLSNPDSSHAFSWTGTVIVLISALGYALYLVTIGQLKSIKIRGLKLTFYIFLFSSILLAAGMSITGKIEAIEDENSAINLILLAFIPTIISNLTLIESIKRIGSTLASVLGAMEPVTAVLIGIGVFNEPLTLSIVIGIVLIISAVTIILR